MNSLKMSAVQVIPAIICCRHISFKWFACTWLSFPVDWVCYWSAQERSFIVQSLYEYVK